MTSWRVRIHTRSRDSSPYEMGHDDRKYPMQKIMAAAELASSRKPNATAELKKHFSDEDSAVRYWAAQGVLMRENRSSVLGTGKRCCCQQDEADKSEN